MFQNEHGWVICSFPNRTQLFPHSPPEDISAVVFSIDFAVKLGITMHLRPPLEFDAAEAWMVDAELRQPILRV